MKTFLCPNCNYPVDVDLEQAQGSAQCVACQTEFEVPLTLADDDDPLGQYSSDSADAAWPDLGSDTTHDPFSLATHPSPSPIHSPRISLAVSTRGLQCELERSIGHRACQSD